MAGEPSFFEIGVTEARRSRAFFEQLFGWTFHPTTGDMAWVETPGVRGGLHDDDPETRIVVYFAVTDIEQSARQVRELGGEAEEPGPEDAGFGRFATCRSDQGVVFGLHQPPSS